MENEGASLRRVTEATRNAVWDEMLDAARMTRYAESMESRYRTLHWIVRFSLLLSAWGSAATILGMFPDGWPRLLPNLAIAFLVAWDFMSGYATKIAVLNSAKRECQDLETEWRELWQNVDSSSATDAEVRERNKELSRRLARATSPMDVEVRVNQKINVATTADAYTVTAARYGAR